MRAPAGRLKRATVDRYLALWGLDHERLTRPPAAVRFEARHGNALWQFDLSPSDLKQVEAPTPATSSRTPRSTSWRSG